MPRAKKVTVDEADVKQRAIAAMSALNKFNYNHHNFSLVFEDPAQANERFIGEPCYGVFAGYTMKKGRVPARICSTMRVANVDKKQLSQGWIKAYLDWVVRESPWSPVYDQEIYKDVDDILNFGLIGLTDKPANYLIGGLEAARVVYEYPQIIKMWQELVNHGVSKNMAFIATQWFTFVEKDLIEERTIPYCGHMPLSAGCMTDLNLKNFLTGTVDEVWLSPPFNERTNFYGVWNVWGGHIYPVGSTEKRAVPRKKLFDVKSEQSRQYLKGGSFGNREPQYGTIYQFSGEDGFQNLADQINQFEKELLNVKA